MHIAICEDLIADRHQTERLMERESAVRKTPADGWYVDSYGSVDAILPFPTTYDLFFLDLANSDTDGLALANLLASKGAQGYFVLMCSSRDYRAEYEAETANAISPAEAASAGSTDFPATSVSSHVIPPEHIRFLDKPLRRPDLAAVLDELCPLASVKERRVEVNGLLSGQVTSVRPDQILWGKSDSVNTDIHLDSAEMPSILTPNEAYVHYNNLCDDPHFLFLGEKLFVNVSHVRTIGALQITMDDGTVFHLLPGKTSAIRKRIDDIRNGRNIVQYRYIKKT